MFYYLFNLLIYEELMSSGLNVNFRIFYLLVLFNGKVVLVAYFLSAIMLNIWFWMIANRRYTGIMASFGTMFDVYL